MNEDTSEWWRKFAQEDALALTVRTTFGLLASTVPFGPIIGEFIAQFVPRQRADRLQSFVEQLNERMQGMEDQFRQRTDTSAAYASLVEQTLVAAVQTPSDERRRDLAHLLAAGLQRDDAQLIEHEALLRLLNQVNDVQLIILMAKANFNPAIFDDPRKQFIALHPGVFDIRTPAIGDPVEVQERWAMRTLQDDQLVTLGFLKDSEGVAKSPRRHFEITTLGRMLLSAIGRLDESWMPRRDAHGTAQGP